MLLQKSHSNPDSKHICLAMHLLNEHCATVCPTVFTVLFLFLLVLIILIYSM